MRHADQIFTAFFGARFLKRVIDDRIKLPISQQWKNVNHVRVALRTDRIAVEAAAPRLVAWAGPEALAG
jgi:hypothetical protein